METDTVSNEISNKAHNSYLPCRTIRALGTFRYDVDNSKLSEDFLIKKKIIIIIILIVTRLTPGYVLLY